MWIFAAGGADVEDGLLGAAEVVAEPSAPPSPAAWDPDEPCAAFSEGWEGEGVDAAVSSTDWGRSMAKSLPALADIEADI